ncbi:MAG: hypothetical protein J5877_04700 [Clostridia bacterium]|nr:hypothetical protein [Clostridia bacterium]
MERFVEKPNLPVKNVRRVIVGKIPESVKNELEKRNIEVLKIKENSLFGNSLSTHADINLVHLGKNRILISDSQQELAQILEKKGFEIECFTLKGCEYPYDCAVNAAFSGENVICRFDILDEKLKRFINDNEYNIINVKQGYSKCSVCVVNGDSIITEDESVKNACEKCGISVLLIRKGYVMLEGFDYGFIGGAAFKLNESNLAFIGKIENHPDFNLIKGFLNKKGINYISLGDTELTDVGSVIPINE